MVETIVIGTPVLDEVSPWFKMLTVTREALIGPVSVGKSISTGEPAMNNFPAWKITLRIRKTIRSSDIQERDV